MMKYEKAIDYELSQRLSGNAREIEVLINDQLNYLKQSRDRSIQDPSLVYHTSQNDRQTLSSIGQELIQRDNISSWTVFSREGRMLTSVFKDEKSQLRQFIPTKMRFFYLQNTWTA